MGLLYLYLLLDIFLFMSFSFIFNMNTFLYGASCWWCSWLRHCATSQKVAGSIADGVIGIFH